MTRRHEPLRVKCAASVLTLLEEAARQAAPKETGGILTGWREGNTVVVRHALVVEDGSAQHATYQRRHAAAEAALLRHLEDLEDRRLGYVGEWHTHPLQQPPSGTDWASLGSVTRDAGGAVALLVAALDPTTDQVTTHAGVGRRNRLGRATTEAVDVHLLDLPTPIPNTDTRSIQ